MPELTDLEQLAASLSSSTAKAQLKTIDALSTLGTSGETVLMEFLSSADKAPIWVQGKVFLILQASESPQVQEFLQSHYPQGIVALNSDRNIDYSSLQELLIAQKFQEADRLTLLKMCELAGESAIKRKWLYFSEVSRFPRTDLRTLDTLWLAYSEGKFGFSVQRELWLGVGKNWEKLWPKIQWRTGKTWTRYPNEFIWEIGAPRGHLPLSNQLRGVRVMDSLLSHPVWNE